MALLSPSCPWSYQRIYSLPAHILYVLQAVSGIHQKSVSGYEVAVLCQIIYLSEFYQINIIHLSTYYIIISDRSVEILAFVTKL